MAGLTQTLLDKAADYLTNKAAGPSQTRQLFNAKFGTGVNILKFPDNVGGDRYPHMMKFTPYEYSSYTMYKGSTGSPVGDEIYLYIPDGLAFTQQHDWSNGSFAELLGNYDVAAGAVEGIGDAFKSKLNEIARGMGFSGDIFDVKGAQGDAKAAITRALATGSGLFGLDSKEAVRFALSGQNVAVNPRYELLFNSTTPRQYVFDFRFVPKTKKESDSIRSIIDCFQYYSLPSGDTGFGARLVGIPAIWKVEFYFGGSLSNKIPPLLDCACVGIDVSYPNGGAGQFATFYDGGPVETALQIRLAETNALTRERYNSLNRNITTQRAEQRLQNRPPPGTTEPIQVENDPGITIDPPATIPVESFDIPPVTEPPVPNVNNNPVGYSPETI